MHWVMRRPPSAAAVISAIAPLLAGLNRRHAGLHTRAVFGGEVWMRTVLWRGQADQQCAKRRGEGNEMVY